MRVDDDDFWETSGVCVPMVDMMCMKLFHVVQFNQDDTKQ